MRPATLLALALVALASPRALAGGGDDGGKGGTKTPKAAPEAPAAKDWSKHTGDIPFIVGREAGMKEVEFTGKPVLFFYTATW